MFSVVQIKGSGSNKDLPQLMVEGWAVPGPHASWWTKEFAVVWQPCLTEAEFLANNLMKALLCFQLLEKAMIIFAMCYKISSSYSTELGKSTSSLSLSF